MFAFEIYQSFFEQDNFIISAGKHVLTQIFFVYNVYVIPLSSKRKICAKSIVLTL